MSDFGFQTRSLYEDPQDPRPQDESAKDAAGPGQPATLRPPVHLDLGKSRRGNHSHHTHQHAHHRKERRMHRLSGVTAVLGAAWARVRRPRTRREKLMALLKLAGIVGGSGFAFLLILWLTLPDISDPAALYASQSTVILDRNGVELYRLYSEQDRTPVDGAGINNFIKQATIAIEDERFFERGCIDVIGLARAGMSQLLPGMLVRSGGSTLTRQFAGNALVGRRNSLIRKIRELMLACQLEGRYDKDELLVLYLNRIPYGHNAYGIEQAARNYFGLHAKDVTLAQSAALAALPQRPSYFSPYGRNVRTRVSDDILAKIAAGTITSASQISDDDVTIGLLGQNVGSGSATVYVGGRTDQVLRNMLDQRMISQEQHDAAVQETKTLAFTRERDNIRAPHFVLSVQKQVQELLQIDEKVLEQGGFQVTTSIDWEMQQIAEKVVAAHKDDLLNRFGAHNAALMSVSPLTREVMAYVGNIDFNDEEHEGKIDMVRSPRQPGSSFKPFVYAAAFEQGYDPATPIFDVPTKFGQNTPQNFGGDFWGLMTMRTALAGSRNIPAIKAFFLAGGEEPVLRLASRLGIPFPTTYRIERRKSEPDWEYGYPLSIGSGEAPLYEMVQGYAALADGGRVMPVVTILKIADQNGNIRYLHKEQRAEQALDPRIAAQITSMLSDVSARPNEYWQSILSVPGYQAAAKTGTSNKCLEEDANRDCKVRRPESTWTMGYTPNLVTGVWVGNATSQSLFERADGLTTAAPIWNEFMAQAHKKIQNPKTAFALPANMTQPLVSRLSGQLASECTPVELRRSDLFLKEDTPGQADPACVRLMVDKVTGLLASPTCPADAAEEQSFFKLTSEKPDRWPTWEASEIEWATRQTQLWRATPDHSGSHLPLPLAPTESCNPALTPGRLEKPTVSLTAPSEGGSVPYPAFRPQANIDVGSMIRQIEYFVDDKPVATFTEPPFNGMVRVPRSITEGGTHVLKIKVTDEYYNTATAQSSFTFATDSGGPRVRFLQPFDGAVVPSGSTVEIEAQADDEGGIERVQFFLGDQLLTTRRSAPYDLSYTLNEKPGVYNLRAVARDSAGNESEASVEIRVEF